MADSWHLEAGPFGHTWHLVMGKGGWARFHDEHLEADVYLRFGDRDGRLEVAELYVKPGAGVTGRFLQRIPLGQVETSISFEDSDGQDFGSELRRRVASDGQDVDADTDSFLKRMVEDRQVPGQRSPGHVAALVGLDPADVVARKKADGFYRQVAELFTVLSGQSKHPAVDIAEQNHVPVTTVHRWVKEARRRGYLQPTRRGTPVREEDP